MYKHYLITRFNVKLYRKEGEPASASEEWLANRFVLFEKYTLPSIKNQACKDFKWLVLFDADTPDKYKRKIEEYSLSLPQFTPIYVTGSPSEMCSEIVLDYINNDNPKEYLITTRIDNDDVIHRDYMRNIQKAFKPAENTFVTFRSGLQYVESTNSMIKFNYIKNHYVSRVERSATAESVMCNHTKIHKLGRLEIHNDKYMWVEIVHGSNVANAMKRLQPTKIESTAEIYGGELTQRSVNYLSLDYLFGSIYYYGKIALENMKFKKRK